MNFILKIVEGPNKGAEIALPEGVSVTLGKSDSCDIVLADRTMPDSPLSVAASEGGVTVDGETLQNFHVRKSGLTSFAVGPADATWGELVWPDLRKGTEEAESQGGERKAKGVEGGGADAPQDPRPDTEKPAPDKTESGESKPEKPAKSRRGCLVCLVLLLLLILAIIVPCRFFSEEVRPYLEPLRPYLEPLQPYEEKAWQCAGRMWLCAERSVSKLVGEVKSHVGSSAPAEPVAETLDEVLARHGIAEVDRGGKTVLVGDFATRAERLAAAAEAYAAQPGIELDFADVESLETAVVDTLALVGETGLKVVAVTNRVAVLSGGIKNIKRALDAISADVPKIANVDVTCVSQAAGNAEIAGGVNETPDGIRIDGVRMPHVPRFASKKASSVAPALPVCGILMTPYPCLVLRDGKRILEGAPVGGGVVVKIEADSVTLTNATGTVVWKP